MPNRVNETNKQVKKYDPNQDNADFRMAIRRFDLADMVP